MQSRWARIGILAGAVVVIVLLFVVLGGDGSDDSGTQALITEEPTGGSVAGAGAGGAGETPAEPPSEPEPEPEPEDPTIVIRGGEPVDGVAELDYTKGDQARFRVRSDVADEVHVHGYEIIKNVDAGGSVKFDFSADIDGLFEVELEGSHLQIAELRVQP